MVITGRLFVDKLLISETDRDSNSQHKELTMRDWGYIQRSAQLSRLEQKVRNFEIAHSKWLIEGKNLIVLMQTELQNEKPELGRVRDMAERIAKHLRQSADLVKELYKA